MKRVFYCPKCNDPTERDAVHDAYFCRACDVWTQRGCSEASCNYCVGRPAKPSLVVQRVNP